MTKTIKIILTLSLFLGLFLIFSPTSAQFSDGTLIKLRTEPKVYVLENGLRRWITSPEIFEQLKYNWNSIIYVTYDTIREYLLGENLNSADQYPDGTLVKGIHPAVYVIESGLRRWIPNEYIFEKMGYWWKNVINISQANLASIPEGQVIFPEPEIIFEPSPEPVAQLIQSPYYHQVRISTLKVKNKNFQDDYLFLYNRSRETINLTGWTLKSERDRVTLPQASNYLTYPLTEKNYSDIQLEPGQQVIISAGPSPINQNFRLNKCTGYLANTREFNPRLPKDCPKPDVSELNLKATCKYYIEHLSRCQIPDYCPCYEECQWDIAQDEACVDYLQENLKYAGCFDNYRRDEDFLEHEWRVYLNRSMDIWHNQHDTIQLLDQDGLLVNEYIY